ncbi:MAG: hypothetical protein A2Z91_08865 [Deltaproteobacteria bacterium GWA2_38_16]|nr:MAG: hypothetical protein A2Z91_08865 [Deltaproteobacteria bacterium GWA2_38_16]OGQ03905.1 MAG: hypothetical protein A3D19_07430 [Deltaproteobacteria bacterium RIFCSPHIGHO2_02_FULL_38_15]OGQ34391.1 MAG: hypothetical protein A3A72_09340 [Deltaproteobacteria bacterium RIFCSPLOWO2_01_FULL_38_9]OGQ59942.1 MAG: hypothetical protein A3G92_03135 [Deltaproteobacteria bacterium RIFCSPLOWO2_12_FULL_38_8]HBQ20952.1 hypothetical protein [Deltaproteobacteria bacterium]
MKNLVVIVVSMSMVLISSFSNIAMGNEDEQRKLNLKAFSNEVDLLSLYTETTSLFLSIGKDTVGCYMLGGLSVRLEDLKKKSAELELSQEIQENINQTDSLIGVSSQPFNYCFNSGLQNPDSRTLACQTIDGATVFLKKIYGLLKIEVDRE